ncbi:M20/M25/M40 family metallo-hydrolase [Actinomadura madurae]|nr:M20/M25/M40 family metallo-hydrolase [Actinomadura madurae]MCQ0020124.1 M20/M25/M40 family metallo-hydrolase [Actinomadura madurae]
MSDSPTPVTRRTFLRRGGAGAVLLTGGVLAGGTAAAAPARVPAAPAPADLDPLALLKKMLAFDTQNFGEGGVTRPHAEMLKAVWDSANVPAEIIPTPKKDNVHLIARIKGTTAAPPLLLLGHSDVVPVERDKWSVDPFAGVVKDGEIYGRGALDMKGANSANIAAVLRHVNEGAKFDRDVIVLTDCDEEAGQYGSAWLAQNHWDKINAGMVLTEGGWFLAQKDRRTPMLITVTRQDKVYFNLDLVADGIATHSSKPNPESAIARLSRAVTDIDTWLAPVALTPVTREYFGALAKATDDGPFERALRLLLAARSQPGPRAGGGARGQAQLVPVAAPGAPADHALLRDRGRGIQGERHPVLRHAADQLPGRARRPAAPRLPGGVPQAARGPRRHRQARRQPRGVGGGRPQAAGRDLGQAAVQPRLAAVHRDRRGRRRDLPGRRLRPRPVRGGDEPRAVDVQGRPRLRRLPVCAGQRPADRHARQRRAHHRRGAQAGHGVHVPAVRPVPRPVRPAR